MRIEENRRPGAESRPARATSAEPAMRVGVALPRFGEVAEPRAIARIAERAEAFGYDTAWLLEPGSEGTFDPLTVAAYLAGRTRSIGFGVWWKTGDCGAGTILRRIRSANAVSEGRMTIAVAHPAGYFDETPAAQASARLVEVTPESARVPVPGTAAIARCQVTFQEIEGARPRFAGSFAQIAGDIAHYRSLGVAEVIVDFAYSATVAKLGDYLMHLERLGEAVGLAPAATVPVWPPDDAFDWLT